MSRRLWIADDCAIWRLLQPLWVGRDTEQILKVVGLSRLRIQSRFSVRPPDWPWHRNLEIWLTVATDSGLFTYSGWEPAVLKADFIEPDNKPAEKWLDENCALICKSRNSTTKWILQKENQHLLCMYDWAEQRRLFWTLEFIFQWNID